MDQAAFQEALLSVMERKDHWSAKAFATGKVPRDRFHIHLEQEYAVFVRDFPRLVAGAYLQCPITEVRKDLAENIYEEETGGIMAGRPHPELFLLIPAGFGFDLGRFDNVELLPGSRLYRDILDRATQGAGWDVAAAVTTIFIEGTRFERGELDPKAKKRPMPPLQKHPLHVHYGVPLSALELPRIHRKVEGGHREAAWRGVLNHVEPQRREVVVAAMERALSGWQWFREDVARAVGLSRPKTPAARARGEPGI